MLQLRDHLLRETLYEGPETRILRITHEPSGEQRLAKMPTSSTPSLRIIGRLVHEHRILSKLADVPGVPRLRSLEQHSGSAALVLQDAGLRSLDRVLADRGRLPLEAALRVVLGLCHVLRDVHAAGVMHKDVKPQNVLVDETYTRVMLVDYGIASELASEATEAGLPEGLEGTLEYISPEQTGRTARGLDSRTDLYSLGVLFFEVLSGRRPFLESDSLALVYAHLAKAPPSIEALVPGLPATVARIVEHCLEKNPEQRYQTANGLAADLEQALKEWTELGDIHPFQIGRKDFSPKLQLPQTLVGRESECAALTAAFERAAAGAVEVMLLGGPTGVGKTALVRSVYREIARAGRGMLLAGKHDQLGRSVPYAALVQAFAGLMNNLAASPKATYDGWRARIENALGKNARVIADVVPELEWLMGTLDPLPVVPTEMAYNRLKHSWIEFVRAVTDASPPLVLFLDDLQWVDPASLELLKTLLLDVGRKHLLVIAAYRNNEIESTHPLWKLIDAVSASGARTSRLTIGPLDRAGVQQWLRCALAVEPDRLDSLAEAFYRKTDGNPFFLGQLLLELFRQGRVRRNLDDGVWQWDQDAVESAAVTDNVVELMRSKVVELPQRTQELLGQAACAGHTFALSELAVLAGADSAQVATELWPAVLAGLLIPSDGQYRETLALAQRADGSELDSRYRFLHDRVQQASYERIAPEQRAKTHLQIGRRLQAAFEQRGGSAQKRLEFVQHLNLGVSVLESAAERTALARLNLEAAKAAKQNGSYRLQAMLVEQGQALAGERAWDLERQLFIDLALERLEADYVLRAFDDIHRRARELLALPLPVLARLTAQRLRVSACLAAGQFEDGVQIGLEALAEQGIRYPDSNEVCLVTTRQLANECDAWLDQHPEGFSALPADPSREHMLCDGIEAAMILCAAIGSRPALCLLVVARNVRQTTERGALTVASPFYIGSLAHIRSAVFGEYRGSVRWAREGEQAATRLASPYLPECLVIRGMYAPYTSPVEESREHYQAGLREATISGSIVGTGWGLSSELYYVELWGGRPLEQVAEREAAQRDLIARAGDAVGQHVYSLVASLVSFLRSPKNARQGGRQDLLTAGSRHFLAIGDGFVAERARIIESHLYLAFGENARALSRAEEAERYRFGLYGVPPVTDIPLWRGLASAKCWSPKLTPEERASLVTTLNQTIERFTNFTEGCAQNFGHKLRLLQAELARIEGRTDDALAAYDDAIEQANDNGFLHIEALAAQFCAEYHLAAGRKRLARHYFQQACDAYTRWGALALVTYLEGKHPEMGLAAGGAPITLSGYAPTTTTTASTTHAKDSSTLDVNTTVRAAQALSSELDPSRVAARLMELVQENAGAQRATLLYMADDKLLVVAQLSGSQVRAGLSEPLSPAHQIAHSVVQFVARTRESVVLSDAPRDRRFADDPYFRAGAVRSILAVPLVHHGRLGGMLFLEHEVAHAFPPARVTLLRVLAAQSAIALENANLYADLQAANAGLEAKVSERTAALDKALKVLWSEMDLAQKIQCVLLPPAQTFAQRYEFAGLMKPTDQVGGDYYDAFEAGGKLWLLVGDVSGHGVSAGLIMMMVQTAVRSLVHSFAAAGMELTPSLLLTLVNRALWNNLQLIGKGQYMTMTAMCIDGNQAIFAGLHQTLLHYCAATGKVEEIESHGIWIGLTPEIEGLNSDGRVEFAPGDGLLLYTDGLTEARRPGDEYILLGLPPVFARYQEDCTNQASSVAIVHRAASLTAGCVVNDDISVVSLRHRGL